MRLAVSTLVPWGLSTVVAYDGAPDQSALVRGQSGWPRAHGATTVEFSRAFLGAFSLQPLVYEPSRARDATADTPDGRWVSIRFIDPAEGGAVIDDVERIELLLHGFVSAMMMQRAPAWGGDPSRAPR